MKLLFVFLSVALCLSNHEGHQVLRIYPESEEQLTILRDLQSNFTLDFWTEPTRMGRSVDIRIKSPNVRQFLESKGLKPEVWISDVQSFVSAQLSAPSADFNASYHTYEDVSKWLSTLPARYPHLATLISVGRSHENRVQWAVRITSTKSTKAKPVFWFDGGIHAREWITTATVVYMVGQLLEDYNVDPAVTSILDNLSIIALPIFNPDGYSYTWTDDRMWRKTRTPNPNSGCVGTDPNRNWPYHWGEGGTSTNPCSEAYQGPSAGSEPCVANVVNYLKSIPNLMGYINFHSYSQLWMSPWGYTDQLPADYKVQNDLSAAAVAALSAVYGTSYQYGTIERTIYIASGSSADWTYGVLKTLYAYGVELRDQGRYGFLLPPDQIVPSGIETYAALKVVANTILKTFNSQ